MIYSHPADILRRMFSVTKHIPFSYGHRIASHHSKCRSPHGHSGVIAASVAAAALPPKGHQADMVVDFGYLKDVLEKVVYDCIDHSFIAAIDDLELLRMFFDPASGQNFETWQNRLRDEITAHGHSMPKDALGGFKLYVMRHAPTAERLAEHFFHRLQKPVADISAGAARLVTIRFWETSSSHADYPGTYPQAESPPIPIPTAF